MKRKVLWVLLAFATAAQALELQPQPQQAQAAHLSAELLSRHHYKAVQLDDALSEKIFDAYLKALDGDKYFFLQSDIDRFAAARTKLDDAILNEDLAVPFAIFNVYAQRLAERFTYARSLLKTGFDFRQSESYNFARDKGPWAKSEDELRDLWRKRVKNDWLRIKLTGKDDKSIADTLDKRYESSIKRIARLKADDAFQIFMNAYTMAIEPHTNYMGPRATEDFDIAMRLSLVGIGAVLETKDEFTTIRELVAGGPAALSGQLKAGDRIVGVAQGDPNAITDVLGWRLDDTVALIRGAADSTVILDILPADAGPDGKHKLVSLVRKKISLEKQAAKKSLLTVKDNGQARQIGVITLPTFYLDFDGRRKGDRDYRSATRDVARLLDELKKEKVDAVLVDLRSNGGGSLSEAIELTGLFIDRGPVVQQRDAKGKVSVEEDTKAGVAWDGPLGVLINRESASASEIFAAAIQDYGRGVIIGEPSFGKGTVQSLVNLDQIAQNGKPQYGELKMTIAQFFRINGGTTQLRGVSPDIAFPSFSDPEAFGESSYTNALPWVQIKAADYKPAGDLKSLLPTLVSRHEARVRNDREFQELLEDLAEIKAQRKKTQVSLHEAERRREREELEARLKARNTADAGGRKAGLQKARLQDDGLQAEERSLASDLAAEKERNGARDALLNEAAQILGDKVALLKGGARMVARAQAGVLLSAEPRRGNEGARSSVR